jgi:DNA-binding HxlR family transcriptional regulator
MSKLCQEHHHNKSTADFVRHLLPRSYEKMSASGRTTQLGLAIEVISDKWRITVLHQLANGPLRTSKLQRNMEGISAKVLTQTLRGLERDGLIERQVSPGVPPRVDYRLTGIAEHLITALDSLSYWSELFGQDTLLARRRYDARR